MKTYLKLLFTLTIAASNTQLYAQSTRTTGSSQIDAISFGDVVSEKSHNLSAGKSEKFSGGLDQSARRLLPGGENAWEGGTLDWQMKIDPQKQNYVTVKLWGSDKGEAAGRLILFANGKQVGYRHEGDYDVLNQSDEESWAPGRFVYVTLPLPPQLTSGQTTVSLKILPIGPMWPYGQTFEQYQKPLTSPTRGIYRAYTHLVPRFEPPADEEQGIQPSAKTRNSPGEQIIARSKELVKARLTKLLTSADSYKSRGNLKAINGELSLLSSAYNVSWAPTYKDTRVVDVVVLNGDAMAQAWTVNNKYLESDWTGAGELGKAIIATWPVLERQMDKKITMGSAEVSRRQAWSNLLLSSIDYWRTHRRSYTNQSMIVDAGIYAANRALRLLSPERALPENKAIHYVYEAVGLEPWVGSDPGSETTGEKDVPLNNVHAPYGQNYYLFTKKGLSRELGWVATYGETIISFFCELVELTGDERIREQLRKVQAARLYFRYPSFDEDGYRCMKLVSEVDNRTAHYPLSGSAYSEPNIREAWWMEVPAVLSDDPVSIGVAQQSVSEGQYFNYVAHRVEKGDADVLGMMRNVNNWEKFRTLPKSSYRLPMTPGQPDFAFADEENAILALKHGDESLFINFYYRAENGVNRAARVFDITPRITRMATVRPEVKVVTSGQTYKRPDRIDGLRSKGLMPPGQDIHQAWSGEELPIAKRPDDANSPTYGEWGPFLGKAAFYWLQYGDYLIGLNTTDKNTYELPVPQSNIVYTDLISNKEVRPQNGVVKVLPLTTVVLYLPNSDQKAR